MGTSSRRFRIATDAIDVVERRLVALPPSRTALALSAVARAYRREIDAWGVAPPRADECNSLMSRLLRLHADLATLERDGPDG